MIRLYLSDCPFYFSHSLAVDIDGYIDTCLSRFVPSCGVYSQVFSIATPAYFLAKLTIPLGKLSILCGFCGFTPFFGYKGELHTSTGDISIFHG